MENSTSTKVKKLKLKKKVDAAAGRKRPPEVQFDVDERSSKRNKRSVTFRTPPSSKVRRLQRGRIPITVLHMFTLTVIFVLHNYTLCYTYLQKQHTSPTSQGASVRPPGRSTRGTRRQVQLKLLLPRAHNCFVYVVV